MKKDLFILTFCAGLLWSGSLSAVEPAERTPEDDLLSIQRELIDLDRQFEGVRKDLFFPRDQEVLVYLRSGLKENFPLRTVELLVDGKSVHRHEYTDTERIAFNFSELQPLYRFDSSPGAHQMVVRLIPLDAKVPMRELRVDFRKDNVPRFVEVSLGFDRKGKSLTVSEKVW